MKLDPQDFFKELETVLEKLEKLSQHPDWDRCCQVALDAGEMTLGDALQAVDWLIKDQTTPLCFWDSNQGGCDEPASPGKQYCSYHLSIIEFDEDLDE